MCSIVTITFSPCIDKSFSVPSLVPEKKLHCSAPVLEPGGGGINVARGIKKLGGEALAIFPSGGYTGRFFNHLLQQEAVPCLVIETAHETRENIIVLEEATNNQFRFGMPATILSEEEWTGCVQALQNIHNIDFIVASGSLPGGVPAAVFVQLAAIAKQKKAKFVLDVPGEALAPALQESVYLIKPNLNELVTLSGKALPQLQDVKAAAEDIIAKGGSEVVVVSMGRAGALLVTQNRSLHIKAPMVKTRSTVGAGDSTVAGIVYALSVGSNMDEAVQYGVACGTAATLNAGTTLCKKPDADRLFNRIYADRLYGC